MRPVVYFYSRFKVMSHSITSCLTQYAASQYAWRMFWKQNLLRQTLCGNINSSKYGGPVWANYHWQNTLLLLLRVQTAAILPEHAEYGTS